ncbi:hypothetical protein M5X06_22270 [Paenibacillus alvei]|uniref:Uncharacterized protein n=1 Tax=Paenibacillus alvei TaxID=44250 RepID=A0ABT4H2I9_PAEAL|nr:hypothetical protein [Paenibacillus alvei]MCY9763195.1 hypothetical protein [Paenibacillus alvei]MCY9769516.1 hypothetical protein [Paenibacillus alvei]
MSFFKKILNKKANITKYKIGERVPGNTKAEKIIKKVTNNTTKRKWL